MATTAVTRSPLSPVLDMIASGEGTLRQGGYDVTLGYGAYSGGPVNLTDMTINEVYALQKQMKKHPKNSFPIGGGRYAPSSAVGRYQFVEPTLRSTARRIGAKGTDKFTPELQDRLALDRAMQRGLGSYLNGTISEASFMNRMAKEWASLPTSLGKGAYPQRTGVKTSTVKSVLTGVKDKFEAGTIQMSDLITNEKRRSVARQQEFLQDAGFEVGPIDGVAGKRTTAAIEQFQEAGGSAQKLAAAARGIDATPTPRDAERTSLAALDDGLANNPLFGEVGPIQDPRRGVPEPDARVAFDPTPIGNPVLASAPEPDPMASNPVLASGAGTMSPRSSPQGARASVDASARPTMANPVLAMDADRPEIPDLPPEATVSTPSALRAAMGDPEPKGDFDRVRQEANPRFADAKFDAATFAPSQLADEVIDGRSSAPVAASLSPSSSFATPSPAPDSIYSVEPPEGVVGRTVSEGPRGAPKVFSLGEPIEIAQPKREAPIAQTDILPTSFAGVNDPDFKRAEVTPREIVAPEVERPTVRNPVVDVPVQSAQRVSNPVFDDAPLARTANPEMMGSEANRQPGPGDFYQPNIPDYVDSSGWKYDPRNPTETPGIGASLGYRRAHDSWLDAGGDPDTASRQRGEDGRQRGGFFSDIFGGWDRDRTKASARGALMGGTVAGPVGALVGGATGAFTDSRRGPSDQQQGRGPLATLGDFLGFDGSFGIDRDDDDSKPSRTNSGGRSKSKGRSSSGSSLNDDNNKSSGRNS